MKPSAEGREELFGMECEWGVAVGFQAAVCVSGVLWCGERLGRGQEGGDKPGPVAERERVVEFLGGTIVSQSDASVTDTVENKFKSRRPYRCCRQNIFAFYMESRFSCHFTRSPTGA